MRRMNPLAVATAVTASGAQQWTRPRIRRSIGDRGVLGLTSELRFDDESDSQSVEWRVTD